MSLPGFGFSEKKPDSHVDQDPLTSGSFRSRSAQEPGDSAGVFGREDVFEIKVEGLVRQYLNERKLFAASVYSDLAMLKEIARDINGANKGTNINDADVSKALDRIFKKDKSKAA